MKDCKLCKQTLHLNQFSKASKTTYSSYCRECKRNLNKKDYTSNKSKRKQYYEDNKDIRKQYYLDTKEQHIERAKNWRSDNQEKASQYNKKYFQNNKVKRYRYMKNRYHNDLNTKIAIIHRSRLLKAIKNKSKSSLEYLGCSIEEVITYITSQFHHPMSWDNHGDIWEIDHIKPLCNFNFENENECNIAFHYTNLQPLFKTSGIAKEHSYIGYIGNRNKKKKWRKPDSL
tara:strand:+ start:277 stop:963 length:687 start_codon:yes stop_codon:yes gene_type:complete